MAYFTPFIDSSGFHIPTYSDIKDALITNARTIFGQDIYLEVDSQDYQWIAAVSNMIYDSFLLAQATFNNRAPGTAIGTGLDAIVKVNGIRRASAIASTCEVVITGTNGTVITNGVVIDVNNIKWNLPATVTIVTGGTITVVATCQTLGAIAASIGTITGINTPTYGWTAVTNSVEAIVGQDIENDAALRARQALSSALPSRSILEGTKAAIAATTGVTRWKLYENDTNSTNGLGHPAHSITAVVEGGSDNDIANAIFLKKTPGCYTNGNVSVIITDSYGVDNTIRFYRPTPVQIDVVIDVTALAGYTSATTDQIKANITEYLNGLDIAASVNISSLWGIALAAMTNLKAPIFSITSLEACVHVGSPGTSDITMDFDEVSAGSIGNITINVT